MTSHAEPRTPLDDVIDDVVHAMSPQVVPDVRARVAERLDERRSSFGWWQPALAAAVVVLAVIGWWPTRNPVSHVDPATDAPLAGDPRPEVPGPSAPATTASTPAPTPVTAHVAPRRPADHLLDVWPVAAPTIAPITVPPISVDAVHVVPAAFDAVEVPRLVVEAIDVEPLPRSNP